MVLPTVRDARSMTLGLTIWSSLCVIPNLRAMASPLSPSDTSRGWAKYLGSRVWRRSGCPSFMLHTVSQSLLCALAIVNSESSADISFRHPLAPISIACIVTPPPITDTVTCGAAALPASTCLNASRCRASMVSHASYACPSFGRSGLHSALIVVRLITGRAGTAEVKVMAPPVRTEASGAACVSTAYSVSEPEISTFANPRLVPAPSSCASRQCGTLICPRSSP
mmetsp:Transcript_23255/g.55336  ORF Transcript_23255/g.55336 Transcript_23255/m.55336 type:complete len:225 (-) Transcript_23255:482-1156(-)